MDGSCSPWVPSLTPTFFTRIVSSSFDFWAFIYLYLHSKCFCCLFYRWPWSCRCLYHLLGYSCLLLIEQIISTSVTLKLNFLTSLWYSRPEFFIFPLDEWEIEGSPLSQILHFVKLKDYLSPILISTSFSLVSCHLIYPWTRNLGVVSRLFLSFLSPSNFVDFIHIIPYNFVTSFPTLYPLTMVLGTPQIPSYMVFVSFQFSSQKLLPSEIQTSSLNP